MAFMKRFGFLLVIPLLVTACESTPTTVRYNEIQEIEVTAWQWNFDPSVVYTYAGQKIRISAHSLDVEHSLTCPELGIDERISRRGGPVTSFEFIVPEAGTYTFISTVPSGPARGRMVLRIIAKETNRNRS